MNYIRPDTERERERQSCFHGESELDSGGEPENNQREPHKLGETPWALWDEHL